MKTRFLLALLAMTAAACATTGPAQYGAEQAVPAPGCGFFCSLLVGVVGNAVEAMADHAFDGAFTPRDERLAKENKKTPLGKRPG